MLKNCTGPITQCIHVCEPTRGHACSCTQCELTFVWAKKTDFTASGTKAILLSGRGIKMIR